MSKKPVENITNSPRDLNELWATASPIYPDEENLDICAKMRTFACRDVSFILSDYNEIMNMKKCELRVVRYGIDMRVFADPKLFFETVAWAVHSNEECKEFQNLFPNWSTLTRLEVFSELEKIFAVVLDHVKNVGLQLGNNHVQQHGHPLLPGGPMFEFASFPREPMSGGPFHPGQAVYSGPPRSFPLGTYNSSAARRKTGRVKNQLREMSKTSAADSSPFVMESDSSHTVPLHPMNIESTSSAESVVSAADSNCQATETISLSPLIGRDESISRRRRYKFINFPGVTGTEQILAPKGVYKTPCGFRVQLNVKGPSAQRKFSRNVAKVHDALWLYEIAILLADLPQDLKSLLNNGNYVSMKSLNVCEDDNDYHAKLLQNINHCFEHELLDTTERDHALVAHEKLQVVASSE